MKNTPHTREQIITKLRIVADAFRNIKVSEQTRRRLWFYGFRSRTAGPYSAAVDATLPSDARETVALWA
jgi:hypothetical protein